MFALLSNEKISMARSFVWICLMTLITMGTGYGIRSYYQYMRQQRYWDESFTIKYIMPVSATNEALSKALIIELLGFPEKKPPHLYRLDTQALEKRLKSFPLIKRVLLTKLHPNGLRVDYELRQPIAYLGGYENTAIDSSGVLFPVRPYYSFSGKPRFFFFQKEEAIKWGQKIPAELFQLALKIGKVAENKLGSYRSIDVSKAFAESLGQRQIVLVKGERNKRVILRLHPKQFEKNLDDYLALEKVLLKENRPYPWIIDFRVPSLAFIHSK